MADNIVSGAALSAEAAEIALERDKLALERERLEHARGKLELERERLRADTDISRLRGSFRSSLVGAFTAVLFCAIGFSLGYLAFSYGRPAAASRGASLLVRSLAEAGFTGTGTNAGAELFGGRAPFVVKSVGAGGGEAGSTTYYVFMLQ